MNANNIGGGSGSNWEGIKMAWHKIREGYWKSQPCGYGREDRKDVYVKPKWVWAPDVNNYMEEKQKADIDCRNYELQKQKDADDCKETNKIYFWLYIIFLIFAGIANEGQLFLTGLGLLIIFTIFKVFKWVIQSIWKLFIAK